MQGALSPSTQKLLLNFCSCSCKKLQKNIDIPEFVNSSFQGTTNDVGLEKIKTEWTPHPHRKNCNVPQTELSATLRHRASDCKKRTRRIIVPISTAYMYRKSCPRTPKPKTPKRPHARRIHPSPSTKGDCHSTLPTRSLLVSTICQECRWRR